MNIKDVFYFEIYNHINLDEKIKEISKLSCLISLNALDEFKNGLKEIKILKPLEIYEIVYQAIAYIGYGEIKPFISYLDEVYKDIKVEEFDNNDEKDKLNKGINKQVEIFGEGMKDFYISGDEYKKDINYMLALNCFGDYYTRGILSTKERELITFILLYTKGFLPNQLKTHINANFSVGNTKEELIDVVLYNIIYTGYPKALNCLDSIKEIANK